MTLTVISFSLIMLLIIATYLLIDLNSTIQSPSVYLLREKSYSKIDLRIKTKELKRKSYMMRR